MKTILKELPATLWWLSGASLVNRLGTMVVPFMMIYLTKDRGLTPEHAGTILTLFGAGAFTMGLAAGALCDRYGAAVLMTVSLIASAFFMVTFPFMESPLAITINAVLLAAALELFRPAAFTAVSLVVKPEQQKTAFAVFRLAINAGMSVGPAAGGFIILYSYHSIFYVNALFALLACALVVLTVWRPLRGKHSSGKAFNVFQALHKALSYKVFAVFLLGLLPIGLIFSQNDSTFPLFVTGDLGLAPEMYGLLFTVNTLIILILELPVNLWLHHWSAKRSLVVGSILFALGFGGFIFATDFLSTALFVAVWTMGEIILFPASAAYVAEISPGDQRGAFMGVYASCFSLAWMLGPFLGTQIYQSHGVSRVWIACFFAALFAAVVFWRSGQVASHSVSSTNQ